MPTPTASRWLMLLILTGSVTALAPSLRADETEADAAGEVSLGPGFIAVNTNRRWLNTHIQRLPDGRLMIPADSNGVRFSDDGMATWSDPLPVLTREQRASHPGSLPTGGATVIATSGGTWVIAWRDPRMPDRLAEYWDTRTNGPVASATANVWTSFSRDQGATWSQPQLVFDRPGGYPPKQIIETHQGTLLMPIQYHEQSPGRNVIVIARSTDHGESWTIMPARIDLGGSGAHDGALEPTLVALRDRVWVLFRTSKGRLWQTFSQDDGLTWVEPTATGFPASSSPPYIGRLRDGRLMLVWNLEKPADGGSYRIRGGDPHFSLERASWWRQELVYSTSPDEGTSWTMPRLVARHAKRNGRVSYPYFFETDDGRVLVFANQGKVEAAIPVDDLPRIRGGNNGR